MLGAHSGTSYLKAGGGDARDTRRQRGVATRASGHGAREGKAATRAPPRTFQRGTRRMSTQDQQGHRESDDGALQRDMDVAGTGVELQSAGRARLWHANPVRDKILRGQTCPARSPSNGGQGGAEGWARRCSG